MDCTFGSSWEEGLVMRTMLWTGLAVLLAAAGGVRADEADAKAIIEKAIKATGGAEALKKFTAESVKTKGKFYGMGEGIDYTAEASYQFPGKMRIEVEGTGF